MHTSMKASQHWLRVHVNFADPVEGMISINSGYLLEMINGFLHIHIQTYLL